MRTKVQKWGNSHGIRLAKAIMEDARLVVGDEVHVHVKEGTIIIVPNRQVRRKYNLEELVNGMADSPGNEEIWGDAVGKEEW